MRCPAIRSFTTPDRCFGASGRRKDATASFTKSAQKSSVKPDEPAIDGEVIEMLLVFFDRVGLTHTTLYINSIGCKECRPKYVELLREELRKVKDQLGPDSQRRIETNPLRVLDSKLPEEQEII